MTKGQMLKFIANANRDINILPSYVLESEFYSKNKKVAILDIQGFFAEDFVIVRSSARSEDTLEVSNAGKYISVLNVNAANEHELMAAIEKVYNSYETAENEEILIQPMMKDIIKSGVVFTADINTYAPYYIVNYEEGSHTDAVTSGMTNDLKTFISYQCSPVQIEDSDMKNVIQVCKKLEFFLNNSFLDIEFAIDSLHRVFIFQVRPIAYGKKNKYEHLDLKKILIKISKKIEKLNKPHPFLLGKKTCFGVMPDWNPAEILGIRPKNLAITLYKELITDHIWAHQRDRYGYRDLTMHPLMVLFCGIPYIDTRITLNSFIPKNLNDKIADKLANYYMKCLEMYPAYHDKIEFKIVFSCYYFGLSKKIRKLLQFDFNENELKRIEFSLLEITNNIINPISGLYKQDIDKINNLESCYNTIVHADISVVDKIYWLIEKCKIYGTLPFAGVARAAFIAVQFLKSFIDVDIITEREYSSFMNSLNTVSKSLNFDLKKVNRDELAKEEFLKKYGHIRPGTYDIMSMRYDEDFEGYFSGYQIEEKHDIEKFRFSKEQKEKIQLALDENGLTVTADQLITFMIEAIEGREYVKLVFTKSVSEIIRLIEKLGVRLDIPKEDLAYLDILEVKRLYVDLCYGDLREIFMNNIQKNKKQFSYAEQIKLPSIIVKPSDVFHYYLLDEEPNFVGLGNVEGDVLTEDGIGVYCCKNKIIFIKSADPGYDFLFTKEIAGLVTQFGGANSHMAIRCAELGIPAVIGAGEKNYLEWSSFRTIKIDCLKKQVESVKYF